MNALGQAPSPKPENDRKNKPERARSRKRELLLLLVRVRRLAACLWGRLWPLLHDLAAALTLVDLIAKLLGWRP